MFWMTSLAMNAMGYSVVENMLHSSVAMLTVSNTIASTVGQPSIPCLANTATDRWSRRDLSVPEP